MGSVGGHSFSNKNQQVRGESFFGQKKGRTWFALRNTIKEKRRRGIRERTLKLRVGYFERRILRLERLVAFQQEDFQRLVVARLAFAVLFNDVVVVDTVMVRMLRWELDRFENTAKEKEKSEADQTMRYDGGSIDRVIKQDLEKERGKTPPRYIYTSPSMCP